MRNKATIERAKEIEEEISHDMMAMVKAIAEECGESGRWVHYGATSNDMLDTATGLQVETVAGTDRGKIKMTPFSALLTEAVRQKNLSVPEGPMVRSACRQHTAYDLLSGQVKSEGILKD